MYLSRIAYLHNVIDEETFVEKRKSKPHANDVCHKKERKIDLVQTDQEQPVGRTNEEKETFQERSGQIKETIEISYKNLQAKRTGEIRGVLQL